MRKVMMIACNPQLHALCVDGTIWQHVSPHGWRQVEAIPDETQESAAPVRKKDPIAENPFPIPFPAPVVKVTE
jgi:hypothetical protein